MTGEKRGGILCAIDDASMNVVTADRMCRIGETLPCGAIGRRRGRRRLSFSRHGPRGRSS
jgi:hypothetical protein